MTLPELQQKIAAARAENPQAAVELVDALLAASVAAGASDLHLLPTAEGLQTTWRIDGVLQPAGSSVPPGFERLELPDATVVLNPAHGAWLRRLAGRFEMVWASTWAGRANDLIGSHLGLPPLAHLGLGTLASDGTRKLPAVRAAVGDRPLAWIDDELYEDAFAWAAGRPAATLLIRTKAYVGLTSQHADELVRFAERSEVRGRTTPDASEVDLDGDWDGLHS